MAKVKRPLMSMEAHGTVAKGLTFSLRKSGQQVRWQRKQKDVITSARQDQRDRFNSAREPWTMTDIGILNFGYFLFGGKVVSISSLPKGKRAPKFACYVRDWLSQFS